VHDEKAVKDQERQPGDDKKKDGEQLALEPFPLVCRPVAQEKA
jgi:hypothetical protein